MHSSAVVEIARLIHARSSSLESGAPRAYQKAAVAEVEAHDLDVVALTLATGPEKAPQMQQRFLPLECHEVQALQMSRSADLQSTDEAEA